MTLAPATLPRAELVGLHATVVEATSEDYVGIEGEVVRETTNTLELAASDRARTVPKRAATFEFELPTEYAVVEGDRLVARPARRTETGGGTLWHSD